MGLAYARRLSFDFEIQKSVLLGMDMIDIDVLECTVTTAHREIGLARARTGGSQGNVLVPAVASGSGGSAGAQNGRKSWGSKHRQQHTEVFCKYHNTNHRDDSYCPARRGQHQHQESRGGKGVEYPVMPASITCGDFRRPRGHR